MSHAAGWKRLYDLAMRYPETVEEAPWGHLALKVRKKVFCFLGDGRVDGEELGLTLKLPNSNDDALAFETATPTGYGMGRHGWVSFKYPAGSEAPIEQLALWLDESYRAVAPKRLVKTLPEGGPPAPSTEPEPTPEPIEVDGAVLLVGDDPLRLARARRWLQARTIDVPELAPLTPEALAIAAELQPVAIIIDVSRNASRGMDLLDMVGATAFRERPILVAGLRDARMARRSEVRLPGATHTQEAPGEGTVLAAFCASLLR